MAPSPRCLSIVAGLILWPAISFGQAIQRCEARDGTISYSNAECPPGTRAARTVAPASQPSPEARQEARERLEREKNAADALAARRQPAATRAAQAYVPADEARRAADCAFLRAELDANRRLRDLLTTRRYYSLDDVEQLDARDAALAADYRSFCTR